MCGILAVLGVVDNSQSKRARIIELSRRLRHRGPDWSGLHCYQDSYLAHQRLAIVDPTSGDQPLYNEDKTVIVTVNGEIYNHKKLKQELSSHKFRTGSDCEVIAHLYEEHGEEFVDMLDGMFSFVLLDTKDKSFIAARDAIGITPLYLGWGHDGSIWFASEMKALVDDCERLISFPPGHIYSSKQGGLRRWYNPTWFSEQIPSTPYEPKILRETFERAVIKRLMTDVPFGVLLSGGLDSSLVAAVANRYLSQSDAARQWGSQLHTFCIGLKGSPDLKAAKEVADYLGTRHHELHFTVQEGIDALEEVIYHTETYDVTTVRASTPMFLMSRKIKSLGVKMVLSGEGSDEIFGGYLYFHKAPNKEELHEETCRKIKALHLYDCLRANKSTSVHTLSLKNTLNSSFLFFHFDFPNFESTLMDPSSISPPSTPAPNAVPFAVEPNNHLPSPSSNHPPYAEMIYTAIEALKEKNGSSKRAISKYIEQVYSHQLPPPESHSNLLTHHLKRLKSDGLLQTIKNSYIIPRSAPPTQPPSTTPTASLSQPSKPRGRPRKSVTPASASASAPPQPLPVVVANNDNDHSPLQNAEPVWAALGLSDEPLDVQPAATPGEGSKRRPGRPPGSKNVPKNSTAPSPSPSQNPTPIEGQVPPTPASRGRGRPPGSKSKLKKKPGRPPKAKTDTPTPAASAAAASDGTKRRPGRPPKNQQQNPTPIPFATTATETPQVVVPEVAVPVTAVDGGTVLTPRSRGRPRKSPAVAAVPVSVVAGGGRGRGRGRGRGGRGRGGRVGNAFGGITLRAPGKRPVGRPKKGSTSASASQNAANEVDLRRKLEHFQGKIKESLTVIKPHFDHQSPVTALAAIQELEILGAMDLSEPLKDDEPHPSQSNAPAQDQPLQAVAQPQAFAQYPPFQQDYHYQQHQSQYQP